MNMLAFFLTRYIQGHDDQDEIVGVKSKINGVWQAYGKIAMFLNRWQGRHIEEHFPSHTNGVKNDEKGVPVGI